MVIQGQRFAIFDSDIHVLVYAVRPSKRFIQIEFKDLKEGYVGEQVDYHSTYIAQVSSCCRAL